MVVFEVPDSTLKFLDLDIEIRFLIGSALAHSFLQLILFEKQLDRLKLLLFKHELIHIFIICLLIARPFECKLMIEYLYGIASIIIKGMLLSYKITICHVHFFTSSPYQVR